MKKLSSLVGILIIGAVTFWLIRYFYLRHIYVITDDAFQMADIVTVSTQDVSGKIVAMRAGEYDAVKAGEVLFKVDDSVYRKNVEELEAKLSALLASRDRLREEFERAKRQLPLQVEAKRSKLKALEEKLRQLEKQKEIAEIDYRTSVEKAKSSLQAARKVLKQQRPLLKVLKASIKGILGSIGRE